MTPICFSKDLFVFQPLRCELNPNTESRPAPEGIIPDSFCRDTLPKFGEGVPRQTLPPNSIFALQWDQGTGGACELPPGTAHAVSASHLHQAGDLEGALYFWNESLAEDPSRYEYYWGRGATLATMGFSEEAANDFIAANTLEPGAPEPLLYLGITELALGNKLSAQYFLSDCHERFPENADAVLALGVLEMTDGEYSNALLRFEEALSLNPNLEQAERYRGSSLVFLERHEESLIPLGNAIASDPQDSSAYFFRGVALANLGRFKEASEDFAAVLNLDPGNELAREYLQHAREDMERR